MSLRCVRYNWAVVNYSRKVVRKLWIVELNYVSCMTIICAFSDHSIGRCLLYGAYATPVSVVCHSTVPLPEGSAARQTLDRLNERIGMCFYTPTCDMEEQITCHRYKAAWTADGTLSSGGANTLVRSQLKLTAVRTHAPGYYRLYSSMFDGNRTDTY